MSPGVLVGMRLRCSSIIFRLFCFCRFRFIALEVSKAVLAERRGNQSGAFFRRSVFHASLMHQTQPFQLVLQPVDGGFDIIDLQWQLLFSYHDFKTRLSNDACPSTNTLAVSAPCRAYQSVRSMGFSQRYCDGGRRISHQQAAESRSDVLVGMDFFLSPPPARPSERLFLLGKIRTVQIFRALTFFTVAREAAAVQIIQQFLAALRSFINTCRPNTANRAFS